jgi:dihydrodipicolinate synthase/N-acetylneuraminate lyase
LGRKGVFPIAPTPFLADGSIDAASVDRMIARTIRSSPTTRRRSSDRVGHSLRHSRLSVDAWRHHDAERHPPDHHRQRLLRHAEARGLARTGKDFVSRRFEQEGKLRRVPILTGNGGLFLDFEMERRVDGAMTGYAFPEMLIDVVRLSREGRREEAHDLFDAHLPLIRYEQQQGVGLATRKYVMMRRGILASDAQRKPGASLSATAKAEVDYLLARLARRDARAAAIADVAMRKQA